MKMTLKIRANNKNNDKLNKKTISKGQPQKWRWPQNEDDLKMKTISKMKTASKGNLAQ